MKYRNLFAAIAAAAVALGSTSCNDSKSYAELLTDEMHSVNNFLANHNVILEIPENNEFIEGPDAPYYRLDEDGNVYMQVINSGDKSLMAENDELIYFRFTRHSLHSYDPATGEFSVEGWGNSDDLSVGAASFRFGNYSLSSSSQWGSGLQMPLNYVGMESEVNLVIKSQYGLSSEISQVIPFLYNIRYFKPGTSSYPETPAEE